MRPRTAGVFLFAGVCTIGVVIGFDPAVLARTAAADVGSVAAISVGSVTVAEFEARGLYIGLPGRVPSAAARVSELSPRPTTVAGSAPLGPTPTVLSGERQAVVGDPASGTTSISGAQAVAVAKRNLSGFVGTPTFGTAVLVQYDDAPAGVVATAWAVPVSGLVQLSYGAVPTSTTPGETIPARPAAAEVAVVFVDAVTGRFISEEGFARRA